MKTIKFFKTKQSIKRYLITRILGLFSLSAVAFVFQACYGTLQDFEDDVLIHGQVTALDTGDPIKGIYIELDKYSSVTTTDENGMFQIYAGLDTSYVLLFSDIDSLQNGLFWPRETTVFNRNNSNELTVNYGLKPQS